MRRFHTQNRVNPRAANSATSGLDGSASSARFHSRLKMLSLGSMKGLPLRSGHASLNAIAGMLGRQGLELWALDSNSGPSGSSPGGPTNNVAILLGVVQGLNA